MKATLSIQKIQQEARLMFSLLDAFECSRPAPTAVTRSLWREAKKRVDASGNYEMEATVFHEILTELDEAGALAGTWIEPRWRAAQQRIGADE
jgi:hypothetical protein